VLGRKAADSALTEAGAADSAAVVRAVSDRVVARVTNGTAARVGARVRVGTGAGRAHEVEDASAPASGVPHPSGVAATARRRDSAVNRWRAVRRSVNSCSPGPVEPVR
jgi:hypothetical protein